MNGNVNLYDTYRANKDGKRYRVIEVGNETVKLVKLNEDGSKKHAGGRPRIMTVADLFRDFTKVNLPPATVSKIAPQKPKQEEVEEVGTPSEKAAQIEKEAVRELSKKDIEKAVEASTFGGKMETPETNALDIEQYKKRVTNLMQMTYDLRKGNEILKAELLDMKKTISKMQQEHEAEVQDLKDQLGEAKAAEAAAKRAHARAVGEKNDYADALDNDSVAFEAILDLAHIAQSVSQSLYNVSKRIEAETEGRI